MADMTLAEMAARKRIMTADQAEASTINKAQDLLDELEGMDDIGESVAQCRVTLNHFIRQATKFVASRQDTETPEPDPVADQAD